MAYYYLQFQSVKHPPAQPGALIHEPTRKGGAPRGGDLVNNTPHGAKAQFSSPSTGED
jgi:hypothetical protein